MQPSEFDRLTPRQMVRFLRLSDESRGESKPQPPGWAVTDDPLVAAKIHTRQNALTESEWKMFQRLGTGDKLAIQGDDAVWQACVERLRGGK